MSAVEFVDLPPVHQAGNRGARGRPEKFAHVREACMANPGQWAVIRKYPTASAASASAAAFRKTGRWDGCEFTSRAGTLYVRYIGGAS